LSITTFYFQWRLDATTRTEREAMLPTWYFTVTSSVVC
jgi:hypothetical protein